MMKAGTWATATKDKNAVPKKIALVKLPMDDGVGGKRSHTVPMTIARPMFMLKQLP